MVGMFLPPRFMCWAPNLHSGDIGDRKGLHPEGRASQWLVPYEDPGEPVGPSTRHQLRQFLDIWLASLKVCELGWLFLTAPSLWYFTVAPPKGYDSHWFYTMLLAQSLQPYRPMHHASTESHGCAAVRVCIPHMCTTNPHCNAALFCFK